MRYNIGNASDFKEREIRSFEFGEHHFCTVLIDRHFYSFQNTCPHQYMPLDVGVIQDKNVICTFHGWRFDLKTGKCKTNPSCTLPVYTVEIEDNNLFVTVEEKLN